MPNKIEIQIVGNNVYAVNAIDGVKTKLGQLQTKANTTAEAMTKRFKAMGASLLAGLSIGAVGSLLKSSIESYKDQEIAIRKLEIALGRNSYTLNQYAGELQKTTVFSDELITESMSLVAAFTKDESQIRKVIQAAMDLSAARGIDLTDATFKVTKAIYTSTNALSKEGVAVEGVAGSTQRLESAIRNISNLYGGQATQQAQTYYGQLIVAQNELDDLYEQIGQRVAPIWLWMTRAFNDSTEALVDFGKEIRGILQWMGIIDEDKLLLMSPRAEKKIDMMTTYHKTIKQLTEAELLAEQKKLEALKKQNEEYELQLTRASNKLQFRGYEDIGGGGVALEMSNQFYDAQLERITEISDADMMYWGLRQGYAEAAFGNMANAMYGFYDATGQRSKAAFAMFKAFSVAQAIAATYVAATAALEPPPIGAGPLWGPVLAATTIATGLANVASILSTNIGSGGGGGGGRSATPSMPGGVVTNNNSRREFIVNVNYSGSGRPDDPDRFAREMLAYFRKAEGDGG